MHLVASVCPFVCVSVSLHVCLSELSGLRCLCVSNQGAFMDNNMDAVDRLLI